jgi:hypothetical protein
MKSILVSYIFLSQLLSHELQINITNKVLI